MTKFNVGDKVKLSPTHPWNTVPFTNLASYFGPDYMDAVFTVTKVNSHGSVSLKRDGFRMNQAWKFSAERFDAVPDELPGAPFKVGGKVRRTRHTNAGVKVDGNYRAKFYGKPGHHTATNLEPVKDVGAEPECATPENVKVGDTVVMARPYTPVPSLGLYWPKAGEKFTVTAIRSGSGTLEVKSASGKSQVWGASRFDLIPAKSEPTHGQGDYILIVMKNGRLAPASTPTVYSSWAQAKAVALSMSAKNPGNDFVIFKKIAEVSAPVPITPKAELKLVA